MDTDLAARVKSAVAAYRRASQRSDAALAELHSVIAEAAAGGVRQNELVTITGYTRERIRQLTRQAERDSD
jgi:hypothetical protein